jgi:hypothetical protein
VTGEYTPVETQKSFFGAFKRETLGRFEIQREEGPEDCSIIELQAQGNQPHNANFVNSRANAIGLLCSLPRQRLVKLLVDVLVRGGKNPEVVDLLCNAVTYKTAVEAGFSPTDDDRHILKGLPTLEALRMEMISRVSQAAPPIISVYSSLVSRLTHLRDQELAFFPRLLRWGKTNQINQQMDKNLKEIQAHCSGILNVREKELYNKELQARVSELRTTFKNKKTSRFLDAIIGRDQSSDFTISSFNPYISRSKTDRAAYTKSFGATQAEVNQGIEARRRVITLKR